MKLNCLKGILLASTLFSQLASATLIGDSINAKYTTTFGTAFNSSATVGDALEFTGSSFLYDISLDFSADSFTLTVSKPFSGGNFTGVFESLEITGIDFDITNVTFDAANSSAFSSDKTPDIDLSNPGSILMSTSVFLSANTPARALSHSFTWDIEFDAVAVSAPPVLTLFAIGLLGLHVRRRHQLAR